MVCGSSTGRWAADGNVLTSRRPAVAVCRIKVRDFHALRQFRCYEVLFARDAKLVPFVAMTVVSTPQHDPEQ